MERVLIAAIVALVVSIVVGPKFIAYLRRKELGQYIREELPAGHVAKAGTPVGGGVLILVAASIAFLALSRYTTAALTVFLATVGCGTIGFVDDYIKLTHRRSLGLPGRWKLLLLVGVAGVVGYLADSINLSTDVYIPVIQVTIPFGPVWYAFVFFVIAGAANGVNLADGIDGLAAGAGIIAVFTFTVISVFTFIRSQQPAFGVFGEASIPHLDLAILGGALIGATIGFLWYNAFPAEVIMGDTGSFALGGALGGFALMLKAEVLLLLIGGIFVLEALSVMLQVVTFKYSGRRIFLMAPIHHHFEMKAWSDTKIMVRFWIVTGILCAAGFALYYRYFPDFFRVRR